MKNFLTKLFLLTFAITAIFSAPSSAEATIAKGCAPIIDGDVDGARKEARKQAMRDAVAAIVGVKVESMTEVVNFSLVRDEIITKSDGYITINRVIAEEARGDIFYVELDVDASADRIRSFAQDLRAQLDANVNESNSRGGIIVAVVQKNFGGSYTFDPTMSDYLNSKLKFIGLRPLANDNVTNYLVYHASDPDVRIRARALAIENREAENALLRGVLNVESVRKVKGFYEATVHASFELIGLDSSEVDVFIKYVKGVAATRNEAIFNAKENATREAVDSLARQALETVQNETRGGGINIKTAVIFENVTNYQAQYPIIKAALEKAQCKIIRMTRPDATTLAFFVSSDNYSNVGELQEFLLNSIPGIQLGINSGELGATKIRLSF